jgi:hypothetical protein
MHCLRLKLRRHSHRHFPPSQHHCLSSSGWTLTMTIAVQRNINDGVKTLSSQNLGDRSKLKVGTAVTGVLGWTSRKPCQLIETAWAGFKQHRRRKGADDRVIDAVHCRRPNLFFSRSRPSHFLAVSLPLKQVAPNVACRC